MDTKLKYQKLIERAIKRGTPTKPFEKHHVVPQCFMKNKWTVNLTVAEHLLAHKYLAEMTQHPKLIGAYHLMITSREGIRLSDAEAVKSREAFIKVRKKQCSNPKAKARMSKVSRQYYKDNPEAGKINGQRMKQATAEIIKTDPTFLKNRAKAISLGKWGKVKLEYNGLCYYNKKYLAEDVGKTTRTITSWIKNGKVKVHQNKSITYDNKKRLETDG